MALLYIVYFFAYGSVMCGQDARWCQGEVSIVHTSRQASGDVTLQRASSAQMETDEARLPGPGPGRRSSKFKGVSWAEAPLKWRTQIWTGTKVNYLVPSNLV